MATVYLARDERHRRSVAIKVLHPDLGHALGAERFLREIDVEANLSHPHILPLFDSGEMDGLLYYVMPYVEGESLRDRLNRETQLPVDEAVQIAREVTDALAHAHGQGVIHRDIKPENILLGGGHALVADFGIARVLGQAGNAPLTDAGMAIGTAAYMSPEQATAADHIDGRSDVYSLGCVMYEMLAGEPPFTGPTAHAIIARALTDTLRPIHTIRAAVSPALDAVISRALARTPADRYASAAAFGSALQVAAAAPSAGARSGNLFRGLARRPLFTVLLVGFLVGIGALFAWRGSHRGDESANAKLVAVLPFENLGALEDEYFVDGIADEIRGRLSTLPSVQVIARNSSVSYKKTAKTHAQIARELGVGYLVTATVQWDKSGSGPRRVHVSPELVDVRGGGVPITKWQQSFDASVTEVFQVYADIAGRVAQSLNVALGDSTRHELAQRPTDNLAAYDAFLRGEDAEWASGVPATLRQAVAAYRQAVALDSGFARAWARLSMALSLLNVNSTPTPEGAEQARFAAERARELAPTSSEAHFALGEYHRLVAYDNARAVEEYNQGIRTAPNDGYLLASLATAEQSLGKWDSAVVHFRRAQTLDPRSPLPSGVLAANLLWLRRYPEASKAAARALALAPTDLSWLELKVMIALAQGDLAGARSMMAAVPKEVDRAALVAYFAYYWDLYWVLGESDQQLLLESKPDAFDDDRAVWALVRAHTYKLRDDKIRARAYADSARIAYEEHLRATPDDPQQHTLYGVALAHLGRKTDAVREGRRGAELLPLSADAFFGPYMEHQLARIYLLLGDPEKSLDHLEPLLKIPYYLSPGWLRIDPDFQSLRGNPRFERLVNGR
jgi:serine/threonine-protein kinase